MTLTLPLTLPVTRSLSFAHARQLALARAGQSPGLASGAPVTTLALEEWSLLHAPLPLGFLGADAGAPSEAASEAASDAGAASDAASDAALEAARLAKAAEAAVEREEAGPANPNPNPNPNPDPDPNP